MFVRSILAAAALSLASQAFADGIPPLDIDRWGLLDCYAYPARPYRQNLRISRGIGLTDILAELYTRVDGQYQVQTWQVDFNQLGGGNGGLDHVYVAPGFTLTETLGLDTPYNEQYRLVTADLDVFMDCSDFGTVFGH